MPSKLETLRQIIIRANPSIMDLMFGCKIKGNQDNPTLSYVGANNLQHCLKIDRTSALLFVDKIKKEEIIGRPITLADVLHTVRWKDFMNMDGTKLAEFPSKNEIKTLQQWNLSLPLEEQDESTWDFLLGVLGEGSSK